VKKNVNYVLSLPNWKIIKIARSKTMKSDKSFHKWAKLNTTLTTNRIQKILDLIHYREDAAYEDGVIYGASTSKTPRFLKEGEDPLERIKKMRGRGKEKAV
jgi:hypothetical protein